MQAEYIRGFDKLHFPSNDNASVQQNPFLQPSGGLYEIPIIVRFCGAIGGPTIAQNHARKTLSKVPSNMAAYSLDYLLVD